MYGLYIPVGATAPGGTDPLTLCSRSAGPGAVGQYQLDLPSQERAVGVVLHYESWVGPRGGVAWNSANSVSPARGAN